MRATVQIHRAQRTHIGNTHYILYRLDVNNSTERPIPLTSAHNGKSLKLIHDLRMCKQTPWSSDSLEIDLALVQYFVQVQTVALKEAVVDCDTSFNSLETHGVRQ